jgi:formylglycine-generating enzyme required for sulfatase activity
MLPVRIEVVEPSKELTYFLGRAHWLDAMSPPLKQHLARIVLAARGILPAVAGETGGAAGAVVRVKSNARRHLTVGVAVAVAPVVLVAFAAWWWASPGKVPAGAGDAGLTLATMTPIKVEAETARKRALATVKTAETAALFAELERAWQTAEVYFQRDAYSEARRGYSEVRTAAEKIELAEARRQAVLARAVADAALRALRAQESGPGAVPELSAAEGLFADGAALFEKDPVGARGKFEAATRAVKAAEGLGAGTGSSSASGAVVRGRGVREEVRRRREKELESKPSSALAPTPDPTGGSAARPGPGGAASALATMTNSLGAAMVLIPAGSFTMGTPAAEEGRGEDEAAWKVNITRPYYIGKTEVTQGQWLALMGQNPSRFKGEGLPVENVSWDDCVEFCRKLSVKEGKTYRLPTEAEWEYACRAGTATAFSFGVTISTDQVNYNGSTVYGGGVKGIHRDRTVAAGSLPANPWGLHEVHGNVWEWCADRYGLYAGGEGTNPTGTESGRNRVLRGGSWSAEPRGCRSGGRMRSAPGLKSGSIGIGLRVVMEVE